MPKKSPLNSKELNEKSLLWKARENSKVESFEGVTARPLSPKRPGGYGSVGGSGILNKIDFGGKNEEGFENVAGNSKRELEGIENVAGNSKRELDTEKEQFESKRELEKEEDLKREEDSSEKEQIYLKREKDGSEKEQTDSKRELGSEKELLMSEKEEKEEEEREEESRERKKEIGGGGGREERKGGELERKTVEQETKTVTLRRKSLNFERKRILDTKRLSLEEKKLERLSRERLNLEIERRASLFASWGDITNFEGGGEVGDEDEAPDGGWGWVVTAGAFILMFVSAIPCVSFGILFSSFLLEHKTSATTTAWIFNLALINSGFFSYFIGPLVNELGWRRVGFVSSLAFGAGMILSAFAMSPEFLFFSFSIIVGCNIEIFMNIAYMVIPHYFTRYRNLANSIMTSGISISQMIMAPAITYLQEEYGFRGATLITGGIFLFGCVASMVLHPVEWHKKTQNQRNNGKNGDEGARMSLGEDSETQNQRNTRKHDSKTSDDSETQKNNQKHDSKTQNKKNENIQAFNTSGGQTSGTNTDLEAFRTSGTNQTSAGKTGGQTSGGQTPGTNTDLEASGTSAGKTGGQTSRGQTSGALAVLTRILRVSVQNLYYLKSPVVLLTGIVLGMLYTVIYNIYTLVPFAMKHEGFTQREASFCLSVSGICNIVSRLMTAFLSCCPVIKIRPLYLFGSFLAAITTIAFSMAQTLTGKALSMGMCGFGYGFSASLYNLYIVEELGLDMLIPTLGIASFLTGILYLILGPISGVVKDLTGSYTATFCFCAACLLVSVILGFLTPAAHALDKRTKDKQKTSGSGC